MDDFHKMHEDLERVIEKDDTSSTITGSDCEETLKHGPHTLRQKLDIIVHSHKFQVGFCCDCLKPFVQCCIFFISCLF